MQNDYQIRQPGRTGRKVAALAALLVFLAAAGAWLYAYVKIHRPYAEESGAVTFSVPRGATTRQVGERLAEEKLVGNPHLFTAYALLTGAGSSIQAGDYQLDRNMSMKTILETLTSGKVAVSAKRVTIVEGQTNVQIAASLERAGLTTAGRFLDALKQDYDFAYLDAARPLQYQGFLFPDTYEFDVKWSAADIAARMLENFESRVSEQMLADMAANGRNLKDVIILASIIEKEVGRSPSVALTPEVRDLMQREREQVASVFYNRLAIGMPLQSDATVNYATGKSDRRALLEDLEVDSPYNTYAAPGLPPGPISNPGIGSIRAAIYPADTDFLYFLNNREGTAFFAETLDGHNQNRADYLD